jgi:hypothetical protein
MGIQHKVFNTMKLSHILILSIFLVTGSQKPIDASEESKVLPAGIKDRIAKLQPTLEQIKNVDPKEVPWGVDLNMVEERGKKARDETLDRYDFSSRITLYQKHKSKARIIANEIQIRAADLTQQKKDLENLQAKLGRANLLERPALKKSMSAVTEKVETLEKEINEKKSELKKNATMMKNFADTIKERVGLSDEQIMKLPDSQQWKEMKKQAGQENKKPIRQWKKPNMRTSDTAASPETIPNQESVKPDEQRLGRKRAQNGPPPPLKSQKSGAMGD